MLKRSAVMCMVMLCAWPPGLSLEAAGTGYRSLVVERDGGERLSFTLTPQLTLGFNEQSLMVRDEGALIDISVPRDGLKGFFVSDEAASVARVETESPGISIFPDNAGVHVAKAVSDSSLVEVFDTEGRSVFSSDAPGACFIPYVVLPHGVNIVKVNGCALKVMVK